MAVLQSPTAVLGTGAAPSGREMNGVVGAVGVPQPDVPSETLRHVGKATTIGAIAVLRDALGAIGVRVLHALQRGAMTDPAFRALGVAMAMTWGNVPTDRLPANESAPSGPMGCRLIGALAPLLTVSAGSHRRGYVNPRVFVHQISSPNFANG
jgi:hypothetical protein